MGEFRIFLEHRIDGEPDDLKKTLAKLPKRHQELLKGYKFSFQCGDTLKGDAKNVGSNDLKKKKIVVCSPWRYSRQFTVLHEVAHCVWQSLVDEQDKSRWVQIAKTIVKETKQSSEEAFCMCYANFYADRPHSDFVDKKCAKFIASLK